MVRYELQLVRYAADGTVKVVDFFDFSNPKPSQSGRLNMHAGGKVVLNGERWQVGANITQITPKA